MGCGAGVARSGSEAFQTTTSSFGSRFGFSKVSSFEDVGAPPPQVVQGLEQLKSVVEDEGAKFLQIQLEAPTPSEHPEFGSELSTLLSSLTLATHLHLDLSGTTWTDELVTVLCDALTVLVRLQHLEVTLRSDAVTDTSAVSLANALETLQRLRHLVLDLKSDYIGDLGAAAIATVFEDLPTLREVRLDFSSTSLADQGLHALANGLSQIGKLQQLRLHISGTGVGSHAIGTLARGLSSMKSLEHIELDLSFTAAGEFAALALASALRANAFTKLNALVLNFEIAAASEDTRTPANASTEELAEVEGSIGQKGMVALCEAIATLSSLTQLRLKLTNQPVDAGLRSDGGKDVSQLSTTLGVLPRLQHLCLDLRGTKLTTANVQSLVAPIRGLQDCRHLECWLGDCRYFDGPMVPLAMLPLLESISTLSNIETLCLDVSAIALGQDGAVALASTTSALPGLKSLKLKAAGCALADELVSLLPKCQAYVALTQLELDFSGNALTTAAHQAIAGAVGSATSLTSLSLRLESTGVDDWALEGLSECIATLTSLTTLELRLRAASELGDQVHDRGLKALSSAMVRLEGLQRVVVRLPSSDIGDEGFVAFGAAIGNRQLERLEVDLGAATRARERAEASIITDKGFAAVARRLRSMRTLAYFVLKIANCGISARGVSIFAQILLEYVRLQQVDFDFHGCELGDAGVSELTSAVVKLPALYHVDLNIRGCSLSSDAAKNLEETLRTADRAVFNEVQL